MASVRIPSFGAHGGCAQSGATFSTRSVCCGLVFGHKSGISSHFLCRCSGDILPLRIPVSSAIFHISAKHLEYRLRKVCTGPCILMAAAYS
ncbi:hypothetical protein [Anaplasma marginale]|uniref:hypothetical protein n=1 Tax=Anaplasma marginale TaxID=770 RepID=UPI0005B51741|nr:hypothetical protein [Anaplasma marginale]